MPMEPSFFSWEESKYYVDDQPESHPGSIYIAINETNLIPAGISTSVTTDIYISTYDDSVESSDTVD